MLTVVKSFNKFIVHGENAEGLVIHAEFVDEGEAQAFVDSEMGVKKEVKTKKKKNA